MCKSVKTICVIYKMGNFYDCAFSDEVIHHKYALIITYRQINTILILLMNNDRSPSSVRTQSVITCRDLKPLNMN